MNHIPGQSDGMFRCFIAVLDLLFLNGLFFLLELLNLMPTGSLQILLYFNISYIISVFVFLPIAQTRMSKSEEVMGRAFWTSCLMSLVFVVLIAITELLPFRWLPCIVNTLCIAITLIISRLLGRSLLKSYRRHNGDVQTVVFLGAGHNLAYLYENMSRDLSTGYRIVGYFDDHVSDYLPKDITLLGSTHEVLDWLETHKVDLLFCNLPSSRSEEILKVLNYCENHLVRFYSVPNVRNYVHRAMTVDFIGDMPVLSIRREPLCSPFNAFVKRVFDLIVASAFILLFFWWILIIVSIITWLTMPGPVFFRQKRNGLQGKEFYCYKFRSMKVNADADRVQATANDPRKTKWGNIMRKTNLDELPQFINVLLGDMSIVGPRPHMVMHTEEYGALIDKYMVRHLAKPGITGWAQVTGSRGETKELWQMEERIKKDIWYVENWTFWLDLRIMYKTVYNMLGGEKGNAY